jgi:hypothetical protein
MGSSFSFEETATYKRYLERLDEGVKIRDREADMMSSMEMGRIKNR